MNVETIKMRKDVATKRLADYEKALERKKDEELESVRDALKALSEGTPVINIDDAILNGGFDVYGRPNLAIARADRKEVSCRWSRYPDTLTFDSRVNQQDWWRPRPYISPMNKADLVWLCQIPLHDALRNNLKTGYAMVPMVPAQVRNERPVDLSKVYILWEVEEWADRSNFIKPDLDPYLLQHLGGSLFAVLAAWDLTEVERLVMSGRNTGQI